MEWHAYRHLLNPGVGRMHRTSSELDEYVREGQAAVKTIKAVAWNAFQAKAILSISRETEWKIATPDGQCPRNLREVSSIISSKEWHNSVSRNKSEEALGELVVGLFVEPGDDWVRSAEDNVLNSLHMTGYEERSTTSGKKASVAQLIKASVSERWKKSLARLMDKNLGWSIGSRIDKRKEVSGRFRYMSIATRRGYKAYRVTKVNMMASERKALAAEGVKRSIEAFIDEGGTRNEAETIADEVYKQGKLCRSSLGYNFVLWNTSKINQFSQPTFPFFAPTP